MDKRKKGKLFLLLIVAIVLLFFIIRILTNNEQRIDETLIANSSSIIDSPAVNVELPEQQIIDGNTAPTGVTEVDYGEKYAKLFGAQEVVNAKQVAEQVMKYWLENEINLEKWRAISTDDFLFLVQSEVLAPKDALQRDVTKLEIELTESRDVKDIRCMIYATWNLISGQVLVKAQTNMYELTLTKNKDGQWVAKELKRA